MEKGMEISLKSRNKSAIWPSNPTTGHVPWENLNSKRHIHPSVYCSTINKSHLFFFFFKTLLILGRCFPYLFPWVRCLLCGFVSQSIYLSVVELLTCMCLILEKGMATHCSILAWRIPWRGAWLSVPGVTKSQIWSLIRALQVALVVKHPPPMQEM